jgi:hypothetical protein
LSVLAVPSNPQQIAPLAILGVVAFMFGLSLFRRRVAIGQQIGWLLRVVGFYLATIIVAAKYMPPMEAFLLGMVVGFVVANRTRPRRSRYVSRAARRKVIARFERTGRRYNSREYEIDHVVPHSKGGTSTADNLKVIPRARNRTKGAKSPWWDAFG